MKLPNLNPDLALGELCNRRFYRFFLEMWETIETVELVPNWHIEYICDQLQEVYEIWARGESQYDVLINVPPGSSKSTIVTQAFPAWLWVKNPSIRCISSSYSGDLATAHAVKTRDMLRSDKFNRLFPGKVEFKADTDGKTHYKNTSNGERFVTSTGGRVTGMHGDFILCLPYDQVISTEKGDIKIGDIVSKEIDVKVSSFNHETNNIEYKDILKYEKNPGRPLLEIETESGLKFRCTEDHLVYTENKGYICAKELQEDDIIITDKWE